MNPKKEALRQLDLALKEVRALIEDRASPSLDPWYLRTAAALERIFGLQSRQLNEFKSVPYSAAIQSSWSDNDAGDDMKLDGLRMAEQFLQSYREEVATYGVRRTSGGDQNGRLELDRISLSELVRGIGRLTIKSAILFWGFLGAVLGVGAWLGHQREHSVQVRTADSLRGAVALADSLARTNRALAAELHQSASLRQSDSLRYLALDSLRKKTTSKRPTGEPR